MIKTIYSLSIWLVMMAIFSGIVHAATIAVSPCSNNTSIQAAVNAASQGDMIEVLGGTYCENIDLSKRITLRGISRGGNAPVLDSMGKGIAVTMSADDTVLEGFILMNSSEAGIMVSSNNNTIRDNDVNNNSNGIIFNRSRNNSVIDNIIRNNTRSGIVLTESTNNSITGNNASNNTDGISLVFSSRNILERNTVSNNKNNGIELKYSRYNILSSNTALDNMLLGISLVDSDNNTMMDNIMAGNRYNLGADGRNHIDTSNWVDKKHVYYLLNALGTVINSSSNAGTVCCIDCVNITIKDLVLANNSIGIYLYNTTGSKIQGNRLINNGKGIYLFKSANNNISVDDARDNDYAIYVVRSDNNTLSIDSTNCSKNRYPSYLDSYSKKNTTLEYFGSQEHPYHPIHPPEALYNKSISGR